MHKQYLILMGMQFCLKMFGLAQMVMTLSQSPPSK